MRPFTLRTDVVTKDKSSKQVDKITKSYMKMTKTVSKESRIAGNSFKRFTNNIRSRSKRALVSMNNLNASVNRTFRNMSKRLGSLGMFVGFAAVVTVLKKGVDIFADFEQANAGLAAVMGKTVEENAALIADSKRLGSITAKTSTEVVALQEAYARLGFAEKDILNLTESTIAGSIAMKGELADTAELVGAMVKSFDGFESVDAPKIIDQMTLATQKSALNFEKLQTGLPIVAGAANAAKIPFTRLVSLMGKLSDAGIDASSSSTALRNIFLDSAKKGHSYTQILANIQKNQSKLTAANDEFGKRGAVSAVILAKNLKATEELDLALQGAKNTAQEAADKQLNTLQGRITLLGSAYEGFVLSLDDGTGAMSGFLKKTVEVATEMLALGSGTAKAKDQLNEAELSVRKIAKTVNFLLKIVKLLVISFLAFKTILIASKIVMGAYNIILGISAALNGTLTKSIVLNSIALSAYKVVSGLATAAQWLLNTAFYGFPLVWILAALAAVVAGIVFLVKNWDELSEKLSKDWTRIKTTFEKEGLGGVFKMWGKDLLIYVLEPLHNLLAIINKLSKGKFGGDALRNTIDLRNKLLEETGRGDEVLRKKATHSFIEGDRMPTLAELKGLSTSENSQIFLQRQSEDRLTGALNKNSEELDKNSAAQDGWTGRFSTSILRDANINERTSRIVQRELATTAISNETNVVNNQREVISGAATTAISNEENVINNQKEVISGAVATPNTSRRSSNVNGTINLIVENRTGGGIGIEVEGTGINVTTTGND